MRIKNKVYLPSPHLIWRQECQNHAMVFGPLNAPDEPIDASYERTRSLVFRSRTFRICRNLSRIAPFQLDKKLTCNT